uniref:Uncharacterized protein n=1 Tax=Neolamprologus brichardi TaxID=32507 RepID=A0A3Q4HML1_NEOBR
WMLNFEPGPAGCRELQVAVESERRHQRENDAKWILSFDLVLACHMKPLEKKDKDGAPRKQPWNPVAPSNNLKLLTFDPRSVVVFTLGRKHKVYAAGGAAGGAAERRGCFFFPNRGFGFLFWNKGYVHSEMEKDKEEGQDRKQRAKATFTLQVLMLNSDFLIKSDFFVCSFTLQIKCDSKRALV